LVQCTSGLWSLFEKTSRSHLKPSFAVTYGSVVEHLYHVRDLRVYSLGHICMIPKRREIRPKIQITSKTDITRAFFDTDHKSFIKKVRLSTVNTCPVPNVHALPYPPNCHTHLTSSSHGNCTTFTLCTPRLSTILQKLFQYPSDQHKKKRTKP
jgi:hypothetical protein